MPETYAVTLMDRIDNLIAAGELNYHQTTGPSVEIFKIEKRPGKKYMKLVCQCYHKETRQKTHGSVWCFIDTKTGAVYKPASFKAPAKHIRYQLMDDASYQEALRRADWSGGWLYIR